MKDTKKKPLFTELTTEQSATVNGACHYGYGYGYGRSIAYHYPSYYDYRPDVNVGVSVSY